MSSLFWMVTITDRRSTDAFLQLYQQHGVNVSLRTVGSGTAVREICAAGCALMYRAPALHSPCR